MMQEPTSLHNQRSVYAVTPFKSVWLILTKFSMVRDSMQGNHHSPMTISYIKTELA